MEHIDIIALVFLSLGLLAVAFGIWAFTAWVKGDDRPGDDCPIAYEDSERPFIEYFN